MRNPSDTRALECSSGAETSSSLLLSGLAGLFDVVAVEQPCLDVVPLLSFAGWQNEGISQLESLGSVLACPADAEATNLLLRDICGKRPANMAKISLALLPNCMPGQQAGAEVQEASSTIVALGDEHQQLSRFAHVAVGGTFDRLHAGHRILLAASALLSTQHVYIGVTGDKLLANKQHAELLEPYDTRRDAAIAYMQAVHPGLHITGGPLLDPKEPTAAATDAKMEALVVSQETVSGAEAINEDRRQRGFLPLTIVVVDLVGKGSKELKGQKLSSTALRARDAGRL